MDKALIKQKSVEIIKFASFVFAFFVVLQCISLAGFSEKSATKFNNIKKDAYSFMNDEENTLQIVSIGNSDVYSGLVPLDLWKEYGYTTTVCASVHQSILESNDLLREIYKTQKPKLVLIEADMFYDDEESVVENEIKKSNKLSDFFDKMNPDNFSRRVEGVYTIFKFHNYWKGGRSNSKSAPYNSHGYKYNTEVCKLKYVDYMQPTDQAAHIKTLFCEQLNDMIELCRENGSEVLLISLPSIGAWNYERHNGVEAYAKENNLAFLDLNLYWNEIGIDMTNCFRDEGNHLNYDGAKKVTSYIGKYVKENYALEDLRGNEKYEAWNRDLRKFEKYKNR